MTTLLGLSAALPLLISSTVAAPEWFQNGNVRITATVIVNDAEQAFDSGRETLDKAAVGICGDKGKPRLIDGPLVIERGVTFYDETLMKLSALYACE